MASKKSKQNHSIQHLLELPSSRNERLSENSEQQSPRTTPRQVPVTVLHPTPKKVSTLIIIIISHHLTLLHLINFPNSHTFSPQSNKKLPFHI